MKRFVMAAWLMTMSGAIGAEASNLLRNGSFEQPAGTGDFNSARYWKYGDPDDNGDSFGSASREAWRAKDGHYIGTVRGLWAGQGTHGGWWQDVAAAPATTYRLSGWFFCDVEWMAQVQEIKIEFWDATRTYLLASYATPIANCDVDWEERIVEGMAPADAAWVRAVVHVSDIGATGALQVDDLALVIVQPDQAQP